LLTLVRSVALGMLHTASQSSFMWTHHNTTHTAQHQAHSQPTGNHL